MSKPPKKGVPAEYDSGPLKGLPRLDADSVVKLDDAELLDELEKQLQRHAAAADENPEQSLQETIREMRSRLLHECQRLLPTAARNARQGKPALLRLISRIVRSAR